MADLAYTDTAEPRRPSLRVAAWRERYRVLAFAGVAALVVGFAAAGGGYDLFDEVACAPRSARRVVEDLVPSDATPADRLFAVDRDPLEGRAPVRAGE